MHSSDDWPLKVTLLEDHSVFPAGAVLSELLPVYVLYESGTSRDGTEDYFELEDTRAPCPSPARTGQGGYVSFAES